MPKYLVLVERTIIDTYEVEAADDYSANEHVQSILDGNDWTTHSIKPTSSEELEPELREEETTVLLDLLP